MRPCVSVQLVHADSEGVDLLHGEEDEPISKGAG